MAAQEVGLAQVPNYREREIEAHARRTTRTSYHVHRSRRRAAMKRRAAVRDSRRAYRIQVIQIQPLNEYRNDVKGALVPKLLAVRVRKTAAEAAIEQLSECDVNPSAGDGSVGALINLTSSGSDGEDETEADKCASVSVHATGLPVAAEVLIDLTSDGLGDEGQGDSEELNEHRGDPEHALRDLPTCGEYQWPRDIVRIKHTENPKIITIPDIGVVDWCGCQNQCEPDSCHNSLTGVYCSTNNCQLGRRCGNRPRELNGLVLQHAHEGIGLGVYTKHQIPAGTVVDEYAGVLSDFDYRNDPQQTSEYTVALSTRSKGGNRLYVEARDRGSISRFMNHSYNSNCRFYEVRNR